MALVRWIGAYREVEAIWLRWATLEGELLPTAQELAQQERRRAIEATERAENLAAKLRELGVDPDDL